MHDHSSHSLDIFDSAWLAEPPQGTPAHDTEIIVKVIGVISKQVLLEFQIYGSNMCKMLHTSLLLCHDLLCSDIVIWLLSTLCSRFFLGGPHICI